MYDYFPYLCLCLQTVVAVFTCSLSILKCDQICFLLFLRKKGCDHLKTVLKIPDSLLSQKVYRIEVKGQYFSNTRI